MAKEPETIYLSVGFEHLLTDLYGYAGHACSAGHTTVMDWKKHLIRVVGSLQTMIRKSINGDDAHRERLVTRCEDFKRAIKGCTRKDEVSCLVAHFSLQISFLLIGGLPGNWKKPRVRPDLVTEPPPFRTLTYCRTPKQRAQQILDAAYHDRFPKGSPTFDDLIEIYDRECKKDSTRFLALVRERFPDVYRQFEP